MECVRKIYRVDRREIYFLRFLLEAYEGAASMTTLDAQEGIVALHVAPGREKEVEALIGEIEHRRELD
jgi:hypothetical protein